LLVAGCWLLLLSAAERECRVSGRVARFFCYNLPKWEKYNDLPGNIPNVNIIWQMAVKHTSIFLCKILQNLPKFGFLATQD
jgi:hypothetical protein